jgi:hypothetical protein
LQFILIGSYLKTITLYYSTKKKTHHKQRMAVPTYGSHLPTSFAGAAIIAVMLTVAGQQVEESASMSMFQSLQRRENYEKKMSRNNPLCTRIKAFLSYNAAYLIMITLWLCWLVFIIVWSMLMVDVGIQTGTILCS